MTQSGEGLILTRPAFSGDTISSQSHYLEAYLSSQTFSNVLKFCYMLYSVLLEASQAG